MENGLNAYKKLLENPYNPIYFSFLFFLVFILVVYIIYLKVIVPLKKKHENEKKKLEIDNLRIIGAFSESDPNPIIRTNIKGDIIHFNKSAYNLFGIKQDGKINLHKIFPELNYDFQKEIENGSNLQTDLTFGGKHFSVYFYGIKTLSMARIYFIDYTERINNEQRIIESEQKYRALTFYLQDHLETEKERIGLELHDSIGQNLYLVKMKLNSCNDCDAFNRSLIEVNSTLDSTIAELREILFNLKPKVLEDLGVFDAVTVLSENLSKNFSVNGTVEYIGNPVRLERKAELYLFRIIQESISNILRHSKATEYHIQFVFSKKLIKVLISDNGVGFEPESVSQYKSYGLLNMSERIKVLNGRMKITSSDEDGTVLLFELPYEAI
jgi:signal transduction histidine kinase